MNSNDPWATYTPTKDDPWTAMKAGHLLRRTGFGPTLNELQQATNDGPAKTLDRIFDANKSDTDFEAASDYAANERSLPRDASRTELAAWWLNRILYGAQPLHEKVVLFWHNHFATSIEKVQNARFMLQQYVTIAKYALGDFREMAQALTLDPAMMIWLDSVGSTRGKPNENYARELMELFTLGIGNYTEADIREAARAFTGYEHVNTRIVFNPRKHDGGTKNVLGERGAWKPADIVRICTAKPACAEFLVRKMYRFFISDLSEPTTEQVQAAAEHYRDSGYNSAAVLRLMFASQHFYSRSVYRRKVKSPIEFVVGIVRGLAGDIGALPLAERLDTLGQQLFAPPSVKGWDGGTSWLNAQTLLLRGNLASALTSGRDNSFALRCDPVAFLKTQKANTPEAKLNLLLKLFFQDDLPEAAKTRLRDYANEHTDNDGVRSLTHLVLSSPEFQLA